MIGVWLLTRKGLPFLVDRDVAENLIKIPFWFDLRHKETKTRKAYGTIKIQLNNKGILLHRYILNAQPGQIVDHINRDVMDNRRENLRFVTPSQNSLNKSIKKNQKSRTKGVSWLERDSRWLAIEPVTRRYLGSFNTEEEAAKAVAEAYSACIRN